MFIFRHVASENLTSRDTKDDDDVDDSDDNIDDDIILNVLA